MIANPTERVLFLAALRLVIEFTRFPFIFTKKACNKRGILED